MQIPIDSEIRNDPRFRALARAVGDEACALLLCFDAWTTAQRYWRQERSYIPEDVWRIGGFEPLEKAGLAERRDGGVYCKGSHQKFDWYHEKRESASVAGKISAAVRRERYGSAQPQKADSSNTSPNDRSTIPNTDSNECSECSAEHLSNTRTTSNVSLIPIPTLKKTSSSCAPSAPDEGPDHGLRPVGLVMVWNENRGTLPAARMTDKRRAKIQARISDQPDPDYWRDVVQRLARSAFATGRVKSERYPNGWRADFDWLIKDDTNHVKVAEGKYDDRRSAAASGYVTLTEKDLDEL